MEREQRTTVRGRSKGRITNSREDAGQGRGKRHHRAQIFDQLNDLGSKQYIQMLEERLRKVESSLEKSSSAQPSRERTAISQSPDLDARDHSNHTERHLASLSGGISTGSQGVPPTVLGASSIIISAAGTQHASQAAFENLKTSTDIVESLDITKDIESYVSNTQESQRRSVSLPELPGSQSDVNLFRSQLDLSGFQRQVFAPVHSQSLLEPFVINALEDINIFYPLFTMASLRELLQQQFLAGPRNCDNNPSRWAITNALVATAIQWKTEHASHQRQRYLGLPSATFYGCFHAWNCGCPHCFEYNRLARASATGCRSTRGWYEQLDHIRAEQHMRVFWVAYCLDSDQMMKQGLPSTFGHEIDLKLPANSPPDGLSDYTLPGTQEEINVLRYMSGLAMIQSRVFTELYSQRALKMNNMQLQGAVAELNHQLDMWKMDLPPDIRPTYDSHPSSSQLEMPVLLLTVIYYTTAGRINMATCRLGYSDDERARSVAQVPAAAARATLRLDQKMPPPPFGLTWQIMYHAVYAVITIFTSILQGPSGSQVQLDLSLITGFVRAVENLRVYHGCDLRNLLDGCKRIEETARNIVNSLGATSEGQYLSTNTHPGRLTDGKYPLTCQNLCGSVDHMQIVHGLMGNIPTLCSEAVNVFADVLGMTGEWTHKYGPFAPESLKSENFNFRFGPP
ncbi:hypothetical protein BKA64DRAFT_649604 [Cadophora sp. MPI-SDFR-AT-0126]|nr:hypothetical protein BKA64DRAFT_649604 [Leotiomycetes sp. MPI-SDFR-AT-0126]